MEGIAGILREILEHNDPLSPGVLDALMQLCNECRRMGGL